MGKFEIGNRVRVVKADGVTTIGMTGVVVGAATTNCDVEMDKSFYKGHNCNGLCRDGYGRNLLNSELELIKKGKVKNMAKIGKAIKVGMKIIDRGCSNKGVILTIYPDQEKATYKDLDTGAIHLSSISDLYIPVFLPEVKSKKKATKKKTK